MRGKYGLKYREEHFWEKVNKDGPIIRPELGVCWLWTGSQSGRGAKKNNGYGRAWCCKSKRCRPAAQIAWELESSLEFPTNKIACHHCDNPKCVRGSHIYAGDNFTNAQDRLRRGRHENANKTHCLRGHPLTEENLYRYGTRRRCRICLRIRDAKHIAKMNAKGYWKNGQSKGWHLRKDMQ